VSFGGNVGDILEITVSPKNKDDEEIY